MFVENEGVKDVVIDDLEALLNDDDNQASPLENDENKPQPTDDVSQTKAFAKRLKESTEKVRLEERESIAKSLGFNSYEELQKSSERKTYEDRGLDPDEISPIVDEIVNKRINEDPRMKELERFKQKQVEEFGQRELAEITKLTDGEITKLEQLPSDVLDLWKTKGSLKAAYLELKGEELLNKVKSKQSKGSTSHMNNLSGNASTEKSERLLTDEEKRIWKFFNPHLTDEELNKKTVKK